VPRKLLIANTVLFAFYAVGVVSSYYAQRARARRPDHRHRPLRPGQWVGTVLFSLFIDPTTAFIVDQTVRGERPKTRRDGDDFLAGRHPRL